MAEGHRILLVTRNLPPLLGGMERLNWHMVEQLLLHAQVTVVAPAASQLPAGASLQGVAGKPIWKFLAGATRAALREARRWRPELVLAGSGLTAPIAWLAARACGARAAVYLHGLDIGLRHPLYALAWLPAIRRMDLVIANSSATRTMAVARGVDASRIRLLHPGTAASPEQADIQQEVDAFRNRYGLGSGPLLLSVGRLTERKGLREFVRDVFPLIAREAPTAQLVVIGEVANQALAARSQSTQSILAEAERHGLADRIHFIGAIADRAALSQAYAAAAVHVFPVREIAGDPEGFGMVAIEAAAHGLPTVAYATGGVVDAVSEGVSGYLVRPHDAARFAEAVCQLLSAPLPPAPSQQFARQFEWTAFGARLREMLQDGRTARGAP